MKSSIFLSLVLISGIMMSAAVVTIPSFAFSPAGAPLIRSQNGESLNWSGYAVSIPNVTSVSGTFVVPSVSGPGTVEGLSTDVSVWVGIDGYTSGTVEQTGISGSYNAASNTATYYAWYEMYPRGSSVIHSMTISSGDMISASVNYIGGGRFTLSISDSTSGQSFSITANAPRGGPNVAQRDSAEWIVERAATIYKGYLTILPLATFSAITFQSASFTVGNEPSITLEYAVSHYTQYAGYPATAPSQPYYEQMYIVTPSGNNVVQLDSTSGVTSNSFTVTFITNGDPVVLPGIYRHSPP